MSHPLSARVLYRVSPVSLSLAGPTCLRYTIIPQIERDFGPFNLLWSMMYDFRMSREGWVNGSFIELDSMKVQADVNTWWTKSYGKYSYSIQCSDLHIHTEK